MPKKRKAIKKLVKKGPHVVRLHTKKKAVLAIMPGSYVNSLMTPINKIEVVAPLEETGGQKFLKFFY